ncbi:MAG: type II toxin-antitoxin system mRNA interferase toxin, RelE/StbE family [Candidatus Kapabacteria bacterium]|nr:type II toxin-antitoxin system mRNA interferase toxin, RelE/StbE family [Candidatus Kapabacteria bacterium]
MSYELIKSTHFTRKASKIIKSNPKLKDTILKTLQLLSDDPFASPLRTHKLKGQLEGSYACSINYEYRIIFKVFSEFELGFNNNKIIFLETIGTHDEVY